jgi:hypothetical protein
MSNDEAFRRDGVSTSTITTTTTTSTSTSNGNHLNGNGGDHLPPGTHVAELAEMHDLHSHSSDSKTMALPGEVEEGNVEYSEREIEKEPKKKKKNRSTQFG